MHGMSDCDYFDAASNHQKAGGDVITRRLKHLGHCSKVQVTGAPRRLGTIVTSSLGEQCFERFFSKDILGRQTHHFQTSGD